MRYFYSKQTRGFYNDKFFSGESMPADVVEISEELHTELMRGQCDGKEIVPDEQGFPVLADIAGPSVEWLAKNYKDLAEKRLDATNWSQTLDAKEELENYEDFVAYRKALREIRRQEVYNLNTTWPDEPKAVWK